jgi:hypothetical protein
MTANYLRFLAFLVSVSYAPVFLLPCLLRYLQITIDYNIGWHVSHWVFSAETPRIGPIVSGT